MDTPTAINLGRGRQWQLCKIIWDLTEGKVLGTMLHKFEYQRRWAVSFSTEVWPSNVPPSASSVHAAQVSMQCNQSTC